MEMEVENTMLDFVENPQILLGREEILSKKEKLLLRKVEFEKGNSKKRKYHGVGPQKRELKCLF